MKKKPIVLLTASLLTAVPVSVCAESLAHLESEEGIIDVLSYAVDSENNILNVICEYQNTTDKSTSPTFQFTVKAFQDGVEMESAYSTYNEDGCKSSMTEIKPGATLKYADSFKISGTSPVELEIVPLFNFDDLMAECTIDLGTEAPASEEPDYEKMYNELKKQFDELQKKYDELSKANTQK